MSPPRTQHDEDLARRVYSYFIFRLRQPDDAERLTRLSFERIWREESLRADVARESDLPVFAAARAVISEHPRPRGASRAPRMDAAEGEAPRRLSNHLAMALGRLHGRERDALALRFGAELSISEIAELSDRTAAEVKQRLARGVRMLIDLGVLPKEGPAPESAAERARPRRAKQRESQKDQSTD